jgi:membrane-associated protease RseP (regulator of RpoE activity)
MDIKKQELIFQLSQWIQIIKIGEKGDNLIIEGYLRPEYSIEDIQRELKGKIRSIKLTHTGDYDLFIIKPSKKVKIPRTNLVLFLVTVLTTLFAGALQEGVNVFREPLMIIKGFPFSITLMLILGIHELGHFTFARKHNVDATLPYFIPAPTIIGTFGAFIKMKSPVRNRLALIEIGAAGPICGFLVALPALFIGLSLSEVVETGLEAGIQLGDSLLMKIATSIVHPNLGEGMDILLHPVGFAAWIGMLVTMLNLLPIGQLDGGHIAYALLGKMYNKVAWGTLFVVLCLSIFSLNWLVWALLVFFLIRVKHPPILNDSAPLTRKEIAIGVAALVIFILTFIPIPIKV